MSQRHILDFKGDNILTATVRNDVKTEDILKDQYQPRIKLSDDSDVFVLLI